MQLYESLLNSIEALTPWILPFHDLAYLYHHLHLNSFHFYLPQSLIARMKPICPQG